jgi:hypothetical protein
MAEFLFPGPIWFIGGKPPFSGLAELCATVLHGSIEDGATKEMARMVYAFSDQDLAGRFLKRAGNQAAAYVPFALTDDSELISLLKELQSHGHQRLGVDIEPSSGVLLPISGVIDQIQRRQGPDSPRG